MCDLPFIVWNRPRPKQLSDPYHDHTNERLRDMLAKRDNELDSLDYRCLLGPWLPAGTYDEVVYFLPHAFRYIQNDKEDASEMITALVGFMSIQANALEADKLLEPSRREMTHRLQRWTEAFQIRHYDETECRSKGWGRKHYDIVIGSHLVCDMLEQIDHFSVHLDLATDFVASLVNHEGDHTRAAWHLELARARLESISLNVKNGELIRLLTEYSLLRASANVLLPSIFEADDVSSYWNDTYRLLGL